MAHIDITPRHPRTGDLRGLRALVLRPLRMLWDGLGAIADANARLRQVERLNRLSDADLQRIGLRREDIVRHVFLDKGHH